MIKYNLLLKFNVLSNYKFHLKYKLTTSLAKRFGICGGVAILPTQKEVEFVKTYCSTYMFSGTLVNPIINASIESGKTHLSSEIYQLQQDLFKKNRIF